MTKKNRLIFTALTSLLVYLPSCGNLSFFGEETSSTSSDTNNNNNQNNGTKTDNNENTNKPSDEGSEEKEDNTPFDNTKFEDDGVPTDTQLEKKIEEQDPVIKSDKYHSGFDKKIYSSLFPYQPIVRQ